MRLVNALLKWVDSESQTVEDMERIIKFLETSELRISTAAPQIIAGLQMRLRDILQQKYVGNPQK